MNDPQRCFDNFRMSPDAFRHLHDILVRFGLPSTPKCGSMEALGLYVWMCAHKASTRESRDRLARSLDTISRKNSAVAKVMYRWAQTILVPADRNYSTVSNKLIDYHPWFDGCIGAIDGTHIEVQVDRDVRVDFFNRKGETSINVCAIVDMEGRFTYVGAGKAGACHDIAVLRDCQEDKKFPHAPAGRYYLADAGYMDEPGFMTPFPNTRYHRNDFRGVNFSTLSRQEKFNYIHAKLRNVIERRFGVLKERWHILERVPFFERKKQAKIIISCFALDNYLWLHKYGENAPSYRVPDWVRVSEGASMAAIKEMISMFLDGAQ